MDFSPTDVNECLTPGVCTHGTCINLEGSFRCSCEQGYEVTPDEKGCQGTRIQSPPLSIHSMSACSSFPLAHIPELTQHSAAAHCLSPTPPNPTPPHPANLRLAWHVCPAESPTQSSMACFRCRRVCHPGLVPHGPLSQHGGLLYLLGLREWVLGE